MTLPSADRLWLIAIASFSVSPVAPVFDALSDPAKSTRFTFDKIFLLPLPCNGSAGCSCSRRIMTTACDRDDSEFISVDATARRLLPCSITAVKPSASCNWRSDKPCTYVPDLGSRRIFRSSLLLPSKSCKTSR